MRVESGTVKRVALVRCGSVTHAFDSDQRYVALQINQFTEIIQGNDSILEVTLTSPAGQGIAPPGMYMLWVIDNNNNPSQRAKLIRVCDQLCSLTNNHSTFSKLEARDVAGGRRG